jgi:hypothetical protein
MCFYGCTKQLEMCSGRGCESPHLHQKHGRESRLTSGLTHMRIHGKSPFTVVVIANTYADMRCF